ncbi:MAG: LysR family transcriptional regulator [Myxococcales bacterium]|nr:LysR family transcriptional regulator [Myxococcales bacterium]
MRFDWNRVRAFLVTAEQGSLSAAARALGLAQSTLSRQVEGLESELDIVLFDRVGRSLVLTPAGQQLVLHAQHMAEGAVGLSTAASGHAEAIEGWITISATEVFSAYVLPPILCRLRQAHPQIRVDVLAIDAAADVRRRQADLAIRTSRPAEPELVARRVGSASGNLYATPAYLDALGRPIDANALSRAALVGLDRSPRMVDRLRQLDLQIELDQLHAVSQSHLVGWQMVKAGLGIGVMTDQIAASDPTVERAWKDLPSVQVPLWLVTHRELRSSRRLRIVFDWMAEALAAFGSRSTRSEEA